MIYKRGKVYWYKFTWQGQCIRESSKQGNDRVARQIEAAHRTALAKGVVGIREKKPIPTLANFIEQRVRPWARSSFEKTCPNNWRWYRSGLQIVSDYRPLASSKLDLISGELAAEFASHRQGQGLQPSTVNGNLRVLRSALHLAVQWGLLESVPVIRMLGGERRRERVLTYEEEAAYLAVASTSLKSVVTVLIDTGLRPDECYSLTWDCVIRDRGRYGALLVKSGKTPAARRSLPMSARVQSVLYDIWCERGKPMSGWVWPTATRSGHFDHSTLKKQHYRALELSKLQGFVLYDLRHTFLTRLGTSGCDAWTLARIAGHSSTTISGRYVHPSDDAVHRAFSMLGGHSSGHTEQVVGFAVGQKKLLTVDSEREEWRARRDSNSRPNAPEAFALSS
jgi:integrase